MILLQHLQNAQMRKAAREAAAQGQANAWPQRARLLGLLLPTGLAVALSRHSECHFLCGSTNGPRVPQKQYGCTLSVRHAKFLPAAKQYVLTTRLPALYHWRPRSQKRFCLRQEAVD